MTRKTTMADIVGLCERAAFRMGLEPCPPPVMTPAQVEALRWLIAHTGDGMFDNNGVLLAAGESAPHVRATWNALGKLGLVEFYRVSAKGRGRLRVTDAGRAAA